MDNIFQHFTPDQFNVFLFFKQKPPQLNFFTQFSLYAPLTFLIRDNKKNKTKQKTLH